MPEAVIVSGLGLMGASLAGALHRAGYRVLLDHRRAEPIEEVAARGWGRPLADADPGDAGLAVVCTPVSTVPEVARGLADVGDAVLTDVASAKAGICRDLADLGRAGRFCASHPMCGSHHRGAKHADPDLYVGATVVLTPADDDPPAAAERVEAMWRALGCRVLRMDPVAHDAAVARVSHLPHVLASLAAGLADPDSLRLAAGGFRDTTRVAAGPSDLWWDILNENRASVLAELARAGAALEELRDALERGDRDSGEAWLEQGRASRTAYEERRAQGG